MESCKILIIFSFLNALTLSGIVFIGRNVSDVLNVVVSPLVATELLTGVVCFWSTCQALCLQKDIVWKMKVTPIMKSVGVVIFGILAFHCVAIFYGVPVTESVSETAHFAMLMSATTFLPCCLALGPKVAAWIRVFAEYRPDNGVESLVQTTTICSIVGAWLGAFPIPLDWDRPWQVWPISCVLGTVMGYIGGLVLGSLRLLYQQRQEQKIKMV